MKKRDVQIGRLAFRMEGANWVAYYAQQGTMKDAIFLGAILLKHVDRPDRKKQFQDLMREFADTCEELFGARPSWRDPIAAPEHERSSNA